MKQQDYNSQWAFKKENMIDTQIVDFPHDAMIVEKRIC